MLKDMFGQQVKVGSMVVMKNAEVHPLRIVAIEGPIVQRTPMGMQSVHTIKAVAEVVIQVVGENGTQFACMRVLEQQEEAAKPKLVI